MIVSLLQEPEDQEYFSQFVTLPKVRLSIHVGNLSFHDGSEVEKHLLQDVMKSIKPWLGELMDNYRVGAPVHYSPIRESLRTDCFQTVGRELVLVSDQVGQGIATNN